MSLEPFINKGDGSPLEQHEKEELEYIRQDQKATCIYDDIMRELKDRNVISCETFAPPFISSYAVHAFNIMNKREKIYWEDKVIKNARLHLIFVANPGGSKSFFLDNFGTGEAAIFGQQAFHIEGHGTINEAGLIGSYETQGNVKVRKLGVAETCSEGFIVCEEFSVMTDSMTQNFNATLEAQMLRLLDSGKAAKAMAAGAFGYTSSCSLWGGVQPMRYELERGMGRRIYFLINMPTPETNKKLRNANRRNKNLRGDGREVAELQGKVRAWTQSIDGIKHIDYDDSVYDLYDQLDIQHFYTPIYDRMILGYTLAKKGASKEVILAVDNDEIRNQLIMQHYWRRDINQGPDLLQIQDIVKTHGICMTEEGSALPKEWMIKRSILNKYAADYQMSTPKLHKKLKEMKDYFMIKEIGDMIYVSQDEDFLPNCSCFTEDDYAMV